MIWIIVTGEAGISARISPIPRERLISYQTMDQIAEALRRYQKDTGTPPTEKQGLSALVKNPGIANWKGPYLSQLPVDGWGVSFRYSLYSNCIGIEGSKPDISGSIALEKNQQPDR